MHAPARSAIVGVAIAFLSVATETSQRLATEDGRFLWQFAAGG
jgi:hypothetical protein